MEAEIISITQMTLATIAGVVACMAGGAIGGLIRGGEALGKQLAIVMGILYGLVGGVPAVLIGLALIVLIR